jgi:Ca-activated chloride channel family protein
MPDTGLKGLRPSVITALVSVIRGGLCLAALLLGPASQAATENVTDGDHSGALHVRTASGQVIRHVPRLHTGVNIEVSGMLVRARVQQRFRNPSAEWVEAVYVFPLPDDAAVDHLRTRFGGRVIEGEIQEKTQARRTYAQARSEGRRASLLEQQRPNIFPTALANIPPGAEIEVEIEYQQTVQYRAGVFSLRFPMVVGPRYIPGRPIPQSSGGFDRHGWAGATDQVPDAARITPPLIDASDRRRNPVSLSLQLQAGVPLAGLRSLYHPVHTEALPAGGQRLRLADGDVPADRDFVLEWRIADLPEPAGALFRERWQGEDYGLLLLAPPAHAAVADEQWPARELVLVVDTSGSMHGASIAQAREALDLALRQLRPRDRFNIIQFSDHTRALFPLPVTASRHNLAQARHYVDGLQAEGGTEMAPALRHALGRHERSGLLRQVVFLTDGDIGNEQALFTIIREQLGEARLYPVAIGSAPNSYFMTRAAAFGRGSYTYIGDLGEVQDRMDQLFARLAAPVLTDIRVTWEGAGRQVQAPDPVPDLHAGEPLLVAVQSAGELASVRVTGMLGGRPWTHQVRLQGGAEAAGVHVLWARRRIDDWMARRTLGEDSERVRSEVLQLALRHHLVSPYTSLVAVDRTPVRPADEPLHSKPLPTHLPKGWSQAHVVGSMPQTATPALLHSLLGLLLVGLGGLGWLRWRVCGAG